MREMIPCCICRKVCPCSCSNEGATRPKFRSCANRENPTEYPRSQLMHDPDGVNSSLYIHICSPRCDGFLRHFQHIEDENVTSSLCDNRFCENEATQRCGRCTVVRYCTRICQRMAWPDHKPLCVRPPEDPAAYRSWVLENNRNSVVKQDGEEADVELLQALGHMPKGGLRVGLAGRRARPATILTECPDAIED